MSPTCWFMILELCPELSLAYNEGDEAAVVAVQQLK